MRAREGVRFVVRNCRPDGTGEVYILLSYQTIAPTAKKLCYPCWIAGPTCLRTLLVKTSKRVPTKKTFTTPLAYMKRFFFAFVLVVGMIYCLFIYGCHREEEKPCTEQTGYDSVEAGHLWMIAYHEGDTLYFKKYRVLKDAGRKYQYIGDEYYVVAKVDTLRSWYWEDIFNSSCDKRVYTNPVQVKFQGPDSLLCLLTPEGSFDILKIFFRDKEFQFDSWTYNAPGNSFYNELQIGQKLYSSVNSEIGFDIGTYGEAGGYVDSTTVFHNYDYGMLKFIINDTLVYERDLR